MDTSITVRLKSCVPLERRVSPLKCKRVVERGGAENQQWSPKTRPRKPATTTDIRVTPNGNKRYRDDCLSPSVSIADKVSTPDSRPSRSSDGLERGNCSWDEGKTLRRCDISLMLGGERR